MKKILIRSILSGILIGLSMNSIYGIPLSPLAWGGMIPLLLSLRNANKFSHYLIASYVFSFVFIAFILFCFLFSFFIGGFLVIVVGSIHLSVSLLILYFFQKRLGWHKALPILAFLWPAWEWFFLQSKISMALFPIHLTQAPMIWLIQFIDISGYNSISFWLVLLNVLIALKIDSWQNSGAKSYKKKNYAESNKQRNNLFIKRFALIVIFMFILPLIYGMFRLNTLYLNPAEKVKVSLIQANTQPHEIMNDSVEVEDVKKYVSMTDSLIALEKTDLIIWPETAVPFSIRHNKPIRDYLFSKVLEWNTPLLTGTYDYRVYQDSSAIPPLQKYLNRNFEVYNSAVLITPQLAYKYLAENLDISKLKIYRKKNLMPLTEYVPYSDKFPFLAHLTLDFGDGGNFSAGETIKSLLFAKHDGEIVDVSPIICWDLLYPASVTEAALNSNNFFAALSNENRLGNIVNSTAHELEGLSRLISIQSRRSIAKCSTTGYTIFSDSFGRVYKKAEWWKEEILTADV